MHHDYYFMWCFNPVFYSKFIWKKRRKNVLIFLVENYLCLNVYTKNLEEKKLIITIDIVEYKILWMRASLMRGFRMDGGRTVRFPQFPRLCDNQDPPSTGEKHGYFLVFITQVAWRFMAYTRDLIKRNHPI